LSYVCSGINESTRRWTYLIRQGVFHHVRGNSRVHGGNQI